MLSSFNLLAAVLLGAAATAQAGNPAVSVVQEQTLPEGSFFRPSGAAVSGAPDATTKYVRSPCPALNTLANHGYISRDGKDLTPTMIRDAIIKVYNIDPALAAALVATLPASLTLAFLSTHNLIEHDASLVHADEYYGADPATVDPELFVDFISRATDGRIGVEAMGLYRKDLFARCAAKPVGCDYTAKGRNAANGEAALVLQAFGGKNNESISVEHATSFLRDERIPRDYAKPATPLLSAELGATSAKIGALDPPQ